MRAIVWILLKFFLFRLDAEVAHRLTISLIQLGARLHGLPLRWLSGMRRSEYLPPDAGTNVVPLHSKNVIVFGIPFLSRVGLAAGFDKDAEMVEALPDLGFGFAELGTVTPRPQPGNNRPRLFRIPSREAIFNRMGFNNLGAEVVAQNLRAQKPHLPALFRVGINIGKNKDTPPELSAEDYLKAVQPFQGLVDYVVINVSSPNTPGLRDLQAVEALQPIVTQVLGETQTWEPQPPVLLKLAPEVVGEPLRKLLRAAESWGISGFVLTNTLKGEFLHRAGSFVGGWSSRPLTQQARVSLIEARKCTRLPIVSVGGICSAEDALWRIEQGADLVQVYSGWIYRGPTFPVAIRRLLDSRLDAPKL